MGKLLCENNLRDVWCRNESVRAEIGPILHTHTHTRVSFSSIDADDIALFSPSAKGLHKLLDMCFTYGCSHDIQFNPSKSVVMYIDSRKLGAARPMVIGSDHLNFVSYYTYLCHIICDDLYDESDMKAKARQMYARSNMLRQRFHFCSADVNNIYTPVHVCSMDEVY